MSTNLKKYKKVPTLPAVAVEVLRLFDEPDTPLADVAHVVRNDPAITSKLLTAANSPKYGARREITDLGRAINMLGRNNVTPLVLSFCLSHASVDDPEQSEAFQSVWLRSFIQAMCAERLAESRGDASFSGECYTTNLLAGIGRLALLKAEPKVWREVFLEAADRSRSLRDIERERFGLTSLELSVELLSEMGVAPRCIGAIESVCEHTVSEESDLLSRITHAACSVAAYLCDAHPGLSMLELEESLDHIEEVYTGSAEELIAEVRQRVEENAALFQVDPSTLPDPSELLQDALDQLSDFSSMVSTQQAVPQELHEENGRLKRRVEDLLKRSQTDTLTGVPNRAFFNDRFLESLALARVRSETLGIAMMDIDKFKSINDTYGHQAGDAVLIEVAAALADAVRDTDHLCRYGGEEFIALLPNCHPVSLGVVGERLRSRVEGLHVVFEGTHIPVTTSVGMCFGIPMDNEREYGNRLISEADAGLYDAKRGGRNRVVIRPAPVEGSVQETEEGHPGPAAPHAPSRSAVLR